VPVAVASTAWGAARITASILRVKAPTVVILAAGQGTRMRSATPKMLHEICGRPMVEWTIRAALDSGAGRVVVVGGRDRALEGHLPDDVTLAVQDEPLGTGDAVRAASEHIDRGAPVVVLAGDAPLVTGEVIAALSDAHAGQAAAATMATMELESPDGYGRVVRAPDGSVERVVETKRPGDATAAELAIREVNTGLFAFDGQALVDALAHLEADNAQGEYYLPDVIRVLRGDGRAVAAFPVDEPSLLLGVNDRADLAAVRALVQRRINQAHMRAGVTIIDPASTVIDADVELGQDTVVEPSSFLRGRTRVAGGCRVGPLTTLIDCELGDGVVAPYSYLVECRVAAGASVGPYAYRRPGAELEDGAKAGTFVEIKNSRIGAGAKIPHLSYIGDAEVGEDSNLGAGTITANYDGFRKHRTRIGARVRGGVDTAFVAPVEVGDDAWTAAGSVVTEDVPDGALAVARARQRNVEGYGEGKERKGS
jgi:bifunctional UDP-N-acetylglucosamine pyrophosphorylase / glucosamine-1-phosphate N-acetyltransferase